jgi:copper homeostasis protein (lipoprotein)
MKKYLLLAGILAVGLVSCNPKDKTLDDAIVEDAQISTEFTDEHTAKNSLDWMGEYEGVLPCADCEGIVTTITLAEDGTFISKEEYKKEPNLVVEHKGTFTWDDAGFVVTLEGEGKEYKRSFKVVENAIVHLDNEGNEITGDLAQHYRLIKQ